MNKTPYEKLGIDPKATQKEIKQAYRRKSKIAHPDKGGDKEEFKSLVKAYDLLADPVKRERYDKTGSENTNSLEKKALQFLKNMFASLVAQVGIELLTYDIIEASESHIETNLVRADENIRKYEENLRVFNKIIKRVKHKEESNPLSALIRNEINVANKNIEMAKEDKEVIKLAKKMLKEYDFKFDEKEFGTVINNMTFTMTNIS